MASIEKRTSLGKRQKPLPKVKLEQMMPEADEL